ncbi:MAG: hypothetical protein ACLFU4_08330 [Opitutales bacterium]
MQKIKALYKRTTVREKLLALVFILVILILWSGNWLGRLGAWNAGRTQSAVELDTQQQWLDRSEEYTEGLDQALERVDPSKTFRGSQLSERVDSLLRQSGLSAQADIDPVRTREGEIFNDHNLRVRLSRISIAQLVQFSQALRKDSPYINIESVRIAANRRNPEQLDVRFEINSFDLKDEAL